MFFYSCQSEYTKMEKAEMAKGVRYDSLFFGIEFNQTKKKFYDICWEKNREGLFSAGGRGNFVRYELPADSADVDKIEMFFYPEFNQADNIIAMDLEYRYKAWSPWNDNFQSYDLIPRIIDSLMAWYGGNVFIEIPDEDTTQTIWAKVDGNRRIAIKAKDEEIVQVKMTDLTNKAQ